MPSAEGAPVETVVPHRGSRAALLICLTLLIGGFFKISAFAREAFIAAKFGLSSATDAYFGLQQLPLTAATFMFGSFALAFTPSYAESRQRDGRVAWLSGLVVYGVFIGFVLTVAMLMAAPLLVRLFVSAADSRTSATVAILSLCFVPIICIGIWAGICTAQGRNLWAMSMTGLPYLLMTLVLPGVYAARSLNELSLPISMTAGFALVGAYSLFRILSVRGTLTGALGSAVSVLRIPDFRRFLRQLTASSTENAGFAANQLLMLHFLARAGTGMVSANNCAMRIGMLGYALLSQPLAQLVQARLCASGSAGRTDLFRRWLLVVASGVLLFAVALYTFRNAIIRAVYMHGKFKGAELNEVSAILPAWIAYFVVMSINGTAARYLFISTNGPAYVRRMLCAYAAANLFRFVSGDALTGASIIWCSVAAEACALAANLRSCFVNPRSTEMVPALAATS